MAITAEKLSAMYTAFNARFRDGMARGRFTVSPDNSMVKYLAKFAELGQNIPSTTGEEVHLWLTQIPGFVEWIGDRIARQIGVNGLRVVNKPYHNTIEIDRDKVDDDTYGAYGNLVANMGAEGNDDAFWMDLLIAALVADDDWADGVAFFSAARKFGDQTCNNVIDGSLTQANLKTAVSRMLGFKGDKDLPLNVVPFMVLCGKTAFWTAKRFLELEKIVDDNGDQVDNETRGIAAPRWHTGLNDDAWYVLGMKGSYMPLCAQRRKEASNLITNVDPKDPNVFWQRKYVYGTDLRGAGFRPFPFLIIRGSAGNPPAAPAPAGKAKDKAA